LFVPGGPGKSVVSWGNALWVVGCPLLGAGALLDGWAVLVFGGGGDGAGGATVLGALAGGAVEGACVTGGGSGAALIGGEGGAVVVVGGLVGSTTPVCPNGSRDTTVIAATMMLIATSPRTPTTIGADQFVHDLRSRRRSTPGSGAS